MGKGLVSVSSRSYILSYMQFISAKAPNTFEKFPSPLGVIFFLILLPFPHIHSDYQQFPSPLGVIFFLILENENFIPKMYESFRLLSELYSFLSYTQKNFCLQ